MFAALAFVFSWLGAFGVIELLPQLDVSAEQAIEPGQPFSIPFRIENMGYSSVYIERVFFCIRKIQWGRREIRESIVSDPGWGNLVLEKGEGESISTHFLQSGAPPDEADMVIAVDVRMSKYFHLTERKYFRFTRFQGPYLGRWSWLKQPSRELQAGVDKQIERSKANQD